MKSLYEEKTANYPRLKTDAHFVNDRNRYQYEGFMDQATKFIEDFQLVRPDLWKRFVQQFAGGVDDESRWKGEFWGKMMRGACFVYSYTRNQELYRLLDETVQDIMKMQEASGRISSYSKEKEFDGWDLWCRKYVLLGMQYFLEICTEDAKKEAILESMKKQMDYIMAGIGDGEGQKPINKATRNWRGLNSSSLLEPVVRLYTLTEDERYLDFATYIVKSGGTDCTDIFELAYENGLYPYQYASTKAYEMISCFEGLLEYYRVTGIEKYKIAVINFANRLLESDFTVIGSSGCYHEQFDHSTVRQANPNNNIIKQETCVTVTVMKFLYQLNLLTGDPRYADAYEISLYNAYLGAINTEKVIDSLLMKNYPDWIMEPVPFDSYSPLTAGIRGNGVGGLQRMADNHYYGCCACIGSAGIGLAPKVQLMTAKDGLVMNLYFNGTVQSETPKGQSITIKTQTDYPADGRIVMTMSLAEAEDFCFRVRIPAWSRKTAVWVNGEIVSAESGYLSLDRTWQEGDTVELELDLRTEAIYPISYGGQVIMLMGKAGFMVPTYDKEDPMAKHHIALRRGPIMLAQENRLGYSVDDPIAVAVREDGYVDVTISATEKAPYPHLVEVEIPLRDGTKMTVTDYASAGKLWTEESKMAVWMLTE